MNQQAKSCSIIIPVLNEASLINSAIDHINSIECDQKPEIIVIDGSPEGETLRAITRNDVKKIRSPMGRGIQMNEGAGYAGGDILLFLHADTELPPDALRLIMTSMEEKRYVAGAFDLGIKSKRLVFRAIEMAASLRSRVTGVPFGDQAIFVQRDYFHGIGGYKNVPIMEDVEFMKRIRTRGDRIVMIRRKVHTSPRRWNEEGVLRCTLRNWFLQILYSFGVSPRRLAALYRHHG